MRSALNAEIGYMNGGGIRSDILAGDVTFNHLLNVMPFNNSVVLAEISGQTLLDMMEMAVMSWPAEDGSFPHLAGVRFSVNTSIPTSVVVNEQEEFVSVSGEYRVYNMEIFDKETEQYVPIDLTDTYTLAASNYFLLDYGSGMTMLKNAKIIQNEGMLDVEALEYYVVDVLGGTISQEYAEATPNIIFTDGKIDASEDESLEESDTETTAADSETTGAESDSATVESQAEPTESESTSDTSDTITDVREELDPAMMIVVIGIAVILVLIVVFLNFKKVLALLKK
jgi:hypothetical protein